MSAAPTVTTVSPALDGVGGAVALVDRARDITDRQPIDEHRWSQAVHGRDQRQRAVVAHTGDDVTGIAVVTPEGEAWTVDLVVDPDRRGDPELVGSLVGAVARVVGNSGGGATQMWVHAADDTDADAAATVGLTQRRDLHQLRVPLPLDVDPIPLDTRPFVVGQDEDAWLAVNAAAFADHPDQGQWTLDDLLAREAEPWFDPTGFLLHEVVDGDDVRLAGFNWTKIHESEVDREALGEIYVIGVHPDFAGRGLGRALCVAGLAHLAEHAPIGMLYVDASNTPAMGLYLGLGFTVDHTNTAFGGRIAETA